MYREKKVKKLKKEKKKKKKEKKKRKIKIIINNTEKRYMWIRIVKKFKMRSTFIFFEKTSLYLQFSQILTNFYT